MRPIETRCGSSLALVVAALLLAAGSTTGAGAIPLDEARMIIELNDTDQDAGIQLFADGEGWRKLKVFDPDGRKIVNFKVRSSVRMLGGVTELFFESEEPSLDEFPLDQILALFPEGRYRFRGKTVDGRSLKGSALFTHVIPAAPQIVQPMEETLADPVNTVVEWQTVADPAGSEIVRYQVIVEREEPSLRVFSADLSARTTQVTVPPEFLEPGTDYKVEVLAVEKGGNQTISEREFSTQ